MALVYLGNKLTSKIDLSCSPEPKNVAGLLFGPLSLGPSLWERAKSWAAHFSHLNFGSFQPPVALANDACRPFRSAQRQQQPSRLVRPHSRTQACPKLKKTCTHCKLSSCPWMLPLVSTYSQGWLKLPRHLPSENFKLVTSTPQKNGFFPRPKKTQVLSKNWWWEQMRLGKLAKGIC